MEDEQVLDGISPLDFAKKIKEKYPQYKDVDDMVLVDKMVAKYPQYKDQIDFTLKKKKRNFRAYFSKSRLGFGTSKWFFGYRRSG